METIKKIHWLAFTALAIISFFIWFQFSYPQLSFSNFSITREQALEKAVDFLNSKNYPIADYTPAVVFSKNHSATRYLQKNLGFDGFKEFVNDYQFDYFYWTVRLFKPGHKEEFSVQISSATGKVISFSHAIEATAYRPETSKEFAFDLAKTFLKETYNFNPDQYILETDTTSKLDNRLNHAFSWHHKDIAFPWSDNPDEDGTAKLHTSINISGNEILSFSHNGFSVPEGFNRSLAKKSEVGLNIVTLIGALQIFLLVYAIYFFIIRVNHLNLQRTKKFYINLIVVFIILGLFSAFNSFQSLIYNFDTTQSFHLFIGRFWFNLLQSLFFASLMIIIPGFAGELLSFEVAPTKSERSFLFFLRTTFFSRLVAKKIFLGYLFFVILLGLQSIINQIGQRYWDVWVEYSVYSNVSTSYIPMLSAFTLGFSASIAEEIKYRLFTINLGKKLFKSTIAAVIIGSIIWGFAHSSYPVFPMWFRGVEVTILGIVFSLVYLRFGIIPVIISHYLFDVFWTTAGYLLGTSQPIYFYSCLAVIILPLIWMILAYFMNRPINLQTLKWKLNNHHQFNLKVLQSYFKQYQNLLSNQSNDQIKKEMLSHGWDPVVVETALDLHRNTDQNN